MSLLVVVSRKLASLAYLRDPSKPFDWGNNDANNSLDTFEVYQVNSGAPSQPIGDPIFTSRCQTVSNTEGLIPGTRHDHTIAPGSFELQAFVAPRLFYGRIHGLRNCRTIAGDWIGADFVIPGNNNRWLVHDWQKHRDTGGPGRDTRVAWSAGCFVLPDSDLAKLGELFDTRGVNAGDVIPGILQEM